MEIFTSLRPYLLNFAIILQHQKYISTDVTAVIVKKTLSEKEILTRQGVAYVTL